MLQRGLMLLLLFLLAMPVYLARAQDEAPFGEQVEDNGPIGGPTLGDQQVEDNGPIGGQPLGDQPVEDNGPIGGQPLD